MRNLIMYPWENTDERRKNIMCHIRECRYGAIVADHANGNVIMLLTTLIAFWR